MTILEMSLGGAVLIAVILLLRRALLYRLPKRTFLLLWAVALCRLLAPFTLPSQLSVYTGAARAAQLFEKAEEIPAAPADTQPHAALPPITSPGAFREDDWITLTVPAPMPEPEPEPVSPLTAVYLTGASLCGLFFLAAYGHAMRRFWDAEPVESDFLRRWQEDHPTLFPVEIKTCGTVSAPLAYGLLWPVILLPENTDWSDEDQLTYVLTHEYVHIRRGDLLWKLLLTGALCLHWFNPLVWAMYLCANQDLELACDEQVVRTLGLENRKGYAYSLLAAAESGFSPLCITYTTKHHMEERIRAIMKIKKKSAAAVLAAALLVTGVTAVFATSKAPEPTNMDNLPQAVMSNTDPKPAPAPVEKDIPAPAPDTSAAADPAPTPVDTDTPNTDKRIHPVTDEPAQPVATASEPREPAQTDPNNRWNVPPNPIPGGTQIPAADEQDMRDLILYLRLERGYTGGFSIGINTATGSRSVTLDLYTENEYVPKDEVKIPKGLLPDGNYPVNSRGETYGTAFGSSFLGYDPDLIGAVATNGEEGYFLQTDHDYFNVFDWAARNHKTYAGYDEWVKINEEYKEWASTQPSVKEIPVYDADRNNIVGYFEIRNGYGYDYTISQEEIEWRLNALADKMREWGNSEEQIARELAEYKASQGWD